MDQISLDIEKEKVPPFVAEHDLPFRFLFSDGKVEGGYFGKEAGIPQLVIIDRDGRIRFHQRGFNPQGFHENLDWMIQAARRPFSETD